MDSETFLVSTGSQAAVRDLTPRCAAFTANRDDGLLHVFVPHATAGLAVLELGAGSDADLLTALEWLLPPEADWAHAHGSPGHGRSHVLPALISPSLTVPVVHGRLTLGRWQSVALIDLNVDNPERTVRVSFMAG